MSSKKSNNQRKGGGKGKTPYGAGNRPKAVGKAKLSGAFKEDIAKFNKKLQLLDARYKEGRGTMSADKYKSNKAKLHAAEAKHWDNIKLHDAKVRSTGKGRSYSDAYADKQPGNKKAWDEYYKKKAAERKEDFLGKKADKNYEPPKRGKKNKGSYAPNRSKPDGYTQPKGTTDTEVDADAKKEWNKGGKERRATARQTKADAKQAKWDKAQSKRGFTSRQIHKGTKGLTTMGKGLIKGALKKAPIVGPAAAFALQDVPSYGGVSDPTKERVDNAGGQEDLVKKVRRSLYNNIGRHNTESNWDALRKNLGDRAGGAINDSLTFGGLLPDFTGIGEWALEGQQEIRDRQAYKEKWGIDPPNKDLYESDVTEEDIKNIKAGFDKTPTDQEIYNAATQEQKKIVTAGGKAEKQQLRDSYYADQTVKQEEKYATAEEERAVARARLENQPRQNVHAQQDAAGMALVPPGQDLTSFYSYKDSPAGDEYTDWKTNKFGVSPIQAAQANPAMALPGPDARFDDANYNTFENPLGPGQAQNVSPMTMTNEAFPQQVARDAYYLNAGGPPAAVPNGAPAAPGAAPAPAGGQPQLDLSRYYMQGNGTPASVAPAGAPPAAVTPPQGVAPTTRTKNPPGASQAPAARPQTTRPAGMGAISAPGPTHPYIEKAARQADHIQSAANMIKQKEIMQQKMAAAYRDRLNPFGVGSGYSDLQRPRRRA